MTRFVVAVALVALLAGAAFVLYGPIDGWPVELRMLVVSGVTLGLSATALACAWIAFQRITALRTDLSVLARSIDLALRDFAQRNTKDVATIGEMNEHVAHELEKIATQLLSREDAMASPSPSAPVDNVVSLPATGRRNRGAAPEKSAAPAVDPGAAEEAYRAAIAAGTFEISLQPIVSVSRSAAAGFEAHASLPVEGRGPIDIRRPESLPDLGTAAFERILLIASLQAGRRRLGSAGEDTPIHVAISEALLNDPQEFRTIIEALELYPEIAKSVVLSLAAPVFGRQRAESDAIQRLMTFGLRFASEGWIEGTDEAAEYVESNVGYLKIPANRLLDREKSKRKLSPAAGIIELASSSDLTIVATDVATDEDAVSLIDLGIDLMIGGRFSGPRRLKPENNDRPTRLAL